MRQREKQRNPVCRRKSSKRKLKQVCRSPLPGRPAKLALLCAKRTGKNRRTDRKTNEFVFSAGLRFFYCPEALFAPFKLQALIVCYCSQAGSPAGFFAAFFPGKKACILPVQFLKVHHRGKNAHFLGFHANVGKGRLNSFVGYDMLDSAAFRLQIILHERWERFVLIKLFDGNPVHGFLHAHRIAFAVKLFCASGLHHKI